MRERTKASELIADLQELIKEYGDLIICKQEYEGVYDINQVLFFNGEEWCKDDPIFLVV